MKTFDNFLQEQQVEEGLNDFLKQYGLEDDWKNHKNKPKPIDAPPDTPKGWQAPSDETLRNLNRVIKQAIDQTPKQNKFGINDMEFEEISKEQTATGTVLHLEASGTTMARNKDHIKRQIEKVVNMAKSPLTQYGIYLEVLYNKLDANEGVEESSMDEPAIGLVHKWDFRVICAAVIRGKN